MFAKIKTWISKLIADDKGEAPRIAKILSGTSVASYIGYAGLSLHAGHFDIAGLGHGLMEVLAGAGALIAGKQLTRAQS